MIDKETIRERGDIIMKKAYAIANFLTSDNKADMTKAAEAAGYEIKFFENPEEASGNVSDAEVLFCNNYIDVIKEMPNLKWCHTAFAGIGDFAKSGIFDSGEVLLSNSNGAYGRTISEYIIMASLMLFKRMTDYNQILYKREWRNDVKIRSIADSVILIVGTGDIGTETAKKFRTLGAKSIIGLNRSGRNVEEFDAVYPIDVFDKLFDDKSFADSIDLIVLCAPGTAESEGMLSRERIAMLSDKTYIVNIGRGTLIDQDALIDALNSGRLPGAVLDVVYPEPLPKDHPLWDAKNVIVTPHVSGNMSLQYTVDKTVSMFCENIGRLERGEKLINQKDIEKGY